MLTTLTQIGQSYQLHRDVYLFKHENVINILDFRLGQFYGLDEIASRMVDLIRIH